MLNRDGLCRNEGVCSTAPAPYCAGGSRRAAPPPPPLACACACGVGVSGSGSSVPDMLDLLSVVGEDRYVSNKIKLRENITSNKHTVAKSGNRLLD